jgi:hypothetical protein
MDITEAREIILKVGEAYEPFGGEGDPIMDGLNLLSALEPKKTLELHPGHDQIWAGTLNFEESVQLMSAEQVRKMAEWGWFEDEDSWSKFC